MLGSQPQRPLHLQLEKQKEVQGFEQFEMNRQSLFSKGVRREVEGP